MMQSATTVISQQRVEVRLLIHNCGNTRAKHYHFQVKKVTVRCPVRIFVQKLLF